MSRRALLGAGGLVVLAGGGFLAYREFSGGSSGPEATAREFLTALDEGDTSTARSFVHEDSPQDFQFGSGTADETSISVTDVRELGTGSETDSRAERRILEVDATVTGRQGTREVTYRIDLRTESGEWKVWTFEVVDPGGSVAVEPAPQATFDFDWEGGSDDIGPLTTTHAGGETIPAGEIHLQGSNPAADTLGRTWAEYASVGPNDGVSTGMSIQVDSVGAAATVRVVWDPGGDDRSEVLADWRGPGA